MKRPIYPGLIGRVVIQVRFNVWNATSQEDISDHFWTTWWCVETFYLSTKQVANKTAIWNTYHSRQLLVWHDIYIVKCNHYLYCMSCFVLCYVLSSYFRTLANTQREKIVKKKIENIVTVVNNVFLFCYVCMEHDTVLF